MHSFSKSAILTSLLIITQQGVAPSAFADPQVKISVAVSQIDMNQQSSGMQLLESIRASARKACMAPGHAVRRTIAGCIRDATIDAVRELDMPSVTAALKEKGPLIEVTSR